MPDGKIDLIFRYNQKIKVMLKKHLLEIKGRMLSYYANLYQDMHTMSENKVDWEEYYEDFCSISSAIQSIKSVSDLDTFCEEFGLNDMESEFAFPSLVAEYFPKKD